MKPHTWIHGEDKNTGYREGKQNGSLWPKTQSFQPGTFWLPGILVNKSIPLLKIITEDSPERKVAAPLCPASPTCPPPPPPSRRSVWARAQLEISAVSRLWFSNQQEESSGDIPPGGLPGLWCQSAWGCVPYLPWPWHGLLGTTCP